MQDRLSPGVLELYQKFSLPTPFMGNNSESSIVLDTENYTDLQLIDFLETGELAKKNNKANVTKVVKEFYSAVPFR